MTENNEFNGEFPPDADEIVVEQPVVENPPAEYPIGYNPPSIPEYLDEYPSEEFPEDRDPELPVETWVPPLPVDDGKVEAEGSVWRLHFAPGETPTDEQMLSLTGAIKSLIVVVPSHSRITPMNIEDKGAQA